MNHDKRIRTHRARIGRNGKPSQTIGSGIGNSGRKSGTGRAADRGLASAHLLKLPVLPDKLGTRKRPQSVILDRMWKDLFPISEECVRVNIRDRLERYINNTYGFERIKPVNYDMYLCDYDGLQNFCFDFQDEDLAKHHSYICVSLISDRQFYDVGSNLEELEEKHPSWGKFLLNQIGNNGVLDILTPGRIWEEADRYFGWIGDEDNQWESEWEEEHLTPYGEIMTPKIFKEYYPPWVFEKAPERCPKDLAEIQTVSDFLCAVKNYFENLSTTNAEYLPLNFAELPGCYASAGGILWTKDRNEWERDPVIIASDEECNSYNEIEGCNPGARCFEFLLTRENQERNLYIRHKLDLFLEVLKTFDSLMKWIRKEGEYESFG